jgi:hypothetical protein
MAGDAAGGGKKRPRVDLLASLDAAFAAKPQKPASKYTSQAAVKEAEATSQQAYLHKRKPKKQSANVNTNANASANANANANAIGSNSKQGDARNGNSNSSNNSSRGQKPPADPLYGNLPVDILAVGLKNCSLVRLLYCIRVYWRLCH